eukprot:6218710-Pyramimonas_sp.AAC.1
MQCPLHADIDEIFFLCPRPQLAFQLRLRVGDDRAFDAWVRLAAVASQLLGHLLWGDGRGDGA